MAENCPDISSPVIRPVSRRPGLRWRTSRRQLYCRCLRTLIRDQSFSIISDDCWGGQLYRECGLPYLTPFVGLYILVPEYLRLLENLREYLKQPLEFTKTDKGFPVARLGDVRVFFMHYRSDAEAAEKWYRRCERICWDRLLVKIDLSRCSQDEGLIESWNRLGFPHSLALCHQAVPAKNCLVVEGWVNNAVTVYHLSKKCFASWIWVNTGRISNPVLYRWAYRLLVGDAFLEERPPEVVDRDEPEPATNVRAGS